MRNIITIGREYGSGGRLVGQKVAEALGIPFYDKEIIAMVAGKSGYTLEYVEQTGEYASTSSFLYNLATPILYGQAGGPFGQANLSNADKIHILQSNIIQEIADKGPCVIVGRSSDYILRERDDCLHAFIYSDMAHKRERAIKYFDIPPEHVEKELARKDKLRARHYKHYTGREWGDMHHFHVCLDSGLLGVDGCRDVLVAIAKST